MEEFIRKHKELVVIFFLLVASYIFYSNFYRSQAATISKLIANRDKALADLREARKVVRTLQKLEQELQDLQKQLDQAKEKLPAEKEIPSLLKEITVLGNRSDVEFVTFKPQPTVPKGFYTELPFNLSVIADYHDLGVFLDRLGKLPRLINVTTLNVSSNPKAPKGRSRNVKADLVVTTFMFVEGGEQIVPKGPPVKPTPKK